uniref:Uncharacterized protein n=1 Tax=Meloidogyne enterolobii TaxID=390850 RepID=A0A6V7UPE2_MELEN|nr:unnamed protein product [Meloidogyne enterolobii]
MVFSFFRYLKSFCFKLGFGSSLTKQYFGGNSMLRNWRGCPRGGGGLLKEIGRGTSKGRNSVTVGICYKNLFLSLSFTFKLTTFPSFFSHRKGHKREEKDAKTNTKIGEA